MTHLKYLYAGIYKSSCGFASIGKFVKLVSKEVDFSTKTSSVEGLLSLRKNLLAGLENQSDEKRAQSILIAEDIQRIVDAINQINENELVFDAERLLSLYMVELRAIGLDVPQWPVRVVDKLPHPFDKFSWAAFCPDEEDERRYGIPKGIYLLQSKLRPYYSDVLLAHELVHTIPGSRNPEMFAMGLEEGFAELLGSLYLGSKAVGTAVAKNLFVYSRHARPIRPNWNAYLDHATQLTAVYRRFGLEGLASILLGGRKKIRDIECKILLGRWSDIELNSGGWDREFEDLIDDSLVVFPRSYVVSPLQLYLIDFVSEGRTFHEICKVANVEYECGRKALEFLGREMTLFVADDEKIEFTNLNLYSDIRKNLGGTPIRYSISEELL